MKYLRTVLFMAVIVGMIFIMDYALVPSGYIRYIIHETNNSDTADGYDNIIVGASHARSAINPLKLDEAGASDNAFNLAIPGETVNDTYYLVMESNRNNNVKRVIYDLDYQYWCNYEEREFEDCFIYTWLPFSNVKLKYIANNLMTKDFRMVYSKRWAYETSPSAIMNNLKVKSGSAYRNYSMDAVEIHDAGGPYVAKGFFYRDMKMDSIVPSDIVAWDAEGISDKVLDSFKKTAQYCKKNNIELVCVTSPITPTTALNGYSEQAGAYFTQLCEEYGVEYYDFNLLTMDILPRTDDDFFDEEGHMLGELADRYSDILASVLLGKCDKNTAFYSTYAQLEQAVYENYVTNQ